MLTGEMMGFVGDRGKRRACWGLVGPVRPFRGGIAQYTTMLHREMNRDGQAMTIAFRQLYPCWLYPGKSIREPGDVVGKEAGVRYLLNPYDPFSGPRVARDFKSAGVEGVIVMWWTAFLALSIGSLASSLRRLEIPVCFLCHNCTDHEASWWKRLAARQVLSMGDRFLVHSSADAGTLRELVPGSSVVMHPHPIYSQYPEPTRALQRSAQLEILFFGLVRHYKGLDILAKAMDLLSDAPVHLSVVGEWWMKDDTLKSFLVDMPQVDVVDHYVTDEEVAEYFSRADVVVLPYRSATGSGVLSIAYHYGKAVIATRVGGLPDVVEDGVSGKLVEPEDPLALARAIEWFLDGSPGKLTAGVRKVASGMTWQSLAATLTTEEVQTSA